MKQRVAIVFGPVQPAWDNGAFFTPVTERLQSRGFEVRLIDTVAPVEESMTVQDLADLWFDANETVDLVCGNALGGAVAQVYAARLATPVPVLSVSGPGRSDAVLAQRLEEIAGLADRGNVNAALALLNRRVTPWGTPTDFKPTAASLDAEPVDPQIARRIALGLRLLCDVDLSQELSTYPGLIITVVGSDSQLVTEHHTIATPRSQTVVFEGAGMRPHKERPELLDSVVDKLIKEMETTSWK